ncbi:MAG TPA: FYDLN acid domain-containing protein [Thermoanaerobaculia bacterium]|nr:FYDLN acid domain-containing protein [Thermoanaerobaculia bacterium]HUM30480.1 FYDLN acid domain-containing protein [Thermoanaerobaculia bacterium]HXK68653.1 FYDLN acid domain-containing protein [Thermoanaerobaculia bacterium]
MNQGLGKKHLCIECGTKFYDLEKPEPACPRCGRMVDEEEEKRHEISDVRALEEVIEDKTDLFKDDDTDEIDEDLGYDEEEEDELDEED